eukprot:g35684.t1
MDALVYVDPYYFSSTRVSMVATFQAPDVGSDSVEGSLQTNPGNSPDSTSTLGEEPKDKLKEFGKLVQAIAIMTGFAFFGVFVKKKFPAWGR